MSYSNSYLRSSLTTIAMMSVLVAIAVAAVAVTIMRGPATERASDAVAERGYTVVSAERDYKFFGCRDKETRVVVHATREGTDKDFVTCVSSWRVRFKD